MNFLVSKGGSSEQNETSLEPPQECHTKQYRQGVPQSQEVSVTVTNRSIARDCQKTKVLPGGITIKSTARECHDLNTSRECHKRKFNKGMQQSK